MFHTDKLVMSASISSLPDCVLFLHHFFSLTHTVLLALLLDSFTPPVLYVLLYFSLWNLSLADWLSWLHVFSRLVFVCASSFFPSLLQFSFSLTPLFPTHFLPTVFLFLLPAHSHFIYHTPHFQHFHVCLQFFQMCCWYIQVVLLAFRCS